MLTSSFKRLSIFLVIMMLYTNTTFLHYHEIKFYSYDTITTFNFRNIHYNSHWCAPLIMNQQTYYQNSSHTISTLHIENILIYKRDICSLRKKYCYIIVLIDWLIEWLIDWLIDWLNDWLIDWLIDR